MDSHSLQDGVVFLQLQALRVVLTVLCRDVARCPGKAALFHLGAFQYDLHAVAFWLFLPAIVLCVLSDYFDVFPIAISLGYRVVQRSVKSYFVDHAETGGAQFEFNPAVLLNVVKFSLKQVYVKRALGAAASSAKHCCQFMAFFL